MRCYSSIATEALSRSWLALEHQQWEEIFLVFKVFCQFLGFSIRMQAVVLLEFDFVGLVGCCSLVWCSKARRFLLGLSLSRGVANGGELRGAWNCSTAVVAIRRGRILVLRLSLGLNERGITAHRRSSARTWLIDEHRSLATEELALRSSAPRRSSPCSATTHSLGLISHFDVELSFVGRRRNNDGLVRGEVRRDGSRRRRKGRWWIWWREPWRRWPEMENVATAVGLKKMNSNGSNLGL
ncbi:hypothetical protein Droror1_Dr00004980 [Drosera rotundifolia]